MYENQPPDQIVKLDLQRVAKQSLFLTLGSFFILFLIYFLLVRKIDISIQLLDVLYFIIGYIILICFHEFFHLIGFRYFGHVPWKRMVVGVNWKLGVAYATTDKLMTNQAIRKALLLPFWTTGVLPAIIGLFLENGLLLCLAATLIGGAAGDFSMYRALKSFPNHWLVKDDPQRPILYLYRPETLKETAKKTP